MIAGRKPSAAVLVSTYNRPKALDLVLHGLSRQTIRPEKIVICDDGSGNETAQVINKWRSLGLAVDHCWHEDRGFRKTVIMNQAIRNIRVDYLIFMDGDCVPFPGFVEDHLIYRQEGCVLAGGRILASQQFTRELEEQKKDFFAINLFDWLKLSLTGKINRWFPLLTLPDGTWRLRQPKKWELLRGCNFSVDRKSLNLVNGFDETIDGWGMEDSDLAVRLINLGLKIKSLRFAAPQLHLWHKEEDRSKLTRNVEFLNETIRTGRVKALKGLA